MVQAQLVSLCLLWFSMGQKLWIIHAIAHLSQGSKQDEVIPKDADYWVVKENQHFGRIIIIVRDETSWTSWIPVIFI